MVPGQLTFTLHSARLFCLEAEHTGGLKGLWIPEVDQQNFLPSLYRDGPSPAAIIEPENSYVWYSSYILLTSVHKPAETNRQKIILWPKEGCHE